MDISEEKKLEILLAQLQDRYEALHKMRDRSMQFALWILGFGLGLAWLLISEIETSYNQQITITIILIAILILTMLFVKAIGHGFNRNRAIMIRIETALKLFEKDTYGIEASILPDEFRKQGTGLAGHFKTLYLLIGTVFLLLIVLTWINPCKYKSKAVCPSNQIHTENVDIK